MELLKFDRKIPAITLLFWMVYYPLFGQDDNLSEQLRLQAESIANQKIMLSIAMAFIILNGIVLIILYRNNNRRKKDIGQLQDQNEKIKAQRDKILSQSVILEQQDTRLKLTQAAARLGSYEYNVLEDRLIWHAETIDIFQDYSQ